MPKTSYSPSWRKYEEDAHNPEDANKALDASDKFIKERDHELKTNPQARRWEESRKASIAKEKPKWTKERLKAEQNESLKPLRALKELGSFVGSLTPMPGFVLIEVKNPEATTESGIVLPDLQTDPNTGYVVKTSAPIVYQTKSGATKVPCIVEVGQKVLFKKGAGVLGLPGAEITLDGKTYRLMRWSPTPAESDILGIFND